MNEKEKISQLEHEHPKISKIKISTINFVNKKIKNCIYS